MVCLDGLEPAGVVTALSADTTVRLSLRQVRRLLAAALPLPTLDAAAVLALLTYQQQHKAAAYRSHRRRKLRLLLSRGPP